MDAKLWTAEEVRMRLEEAAETLKALRLSLRDVPSRRVTRWPDVVNDAVEAYGYGQAHVRPAAPSPAKISRADEAVQWLFWLSDEQRKIVWARACRITWRRLEDLDGRSHSALRKVFGAGIDVILKHLERALSHDESIRLAFGKARKVRFTDKMVGKGPPIARRR
ncbi:MAG: DUF6362 family protein [Alphaproteobacteria bacterium]